MLRVVKCAEREKPKQFSKVLPVGTVRKRAGKTRTTAAVEWTKFRGDLENTGYSPGRVAEKFELRWETKLPGAREFWSSPCIPGGKLFVGNQDSCLYRLDAATGQLVWTYDTGFGYRDEIKKVYEGEIVIAADRIDPRDASGGLKDPS